MQERDSHGLFQLGVSSNVGVQGFSEDTHGRLWVTDRVGGFRPADRPANATRPARLGLEGRGFHLFHDSRGNLWVGTHGHGLWRVRDLGRTGAPLVEVGTEESGLLSNGIWCVIEDRENNIWVGTTAGCTVSPHRPRSPNTALVRSVEAAAEAVSGSARRQE